MEANNYTPDYNAVSLSDFKKNPGAYLRDSQNIPMAIFKYNHIAGWLLTNQSFQNLLERNRALSAEIQELTGLLARIAPGLVDLAKVMPPASDRAPLKPKWPIFGVYRGRVRKPNYTDERLSEAMEFGKAYVEALSGRHGSRPENEDQVEDDEW
jgi:hypothetical protein